MKVGTWMDVEGSGYNRWNGSGIASHSITQLDSFVDQGKVE